MKLHDRFDGCHRGRRLAVAALFAAVAGLGLPARACDTPVFLYALDNWEADSYDVVIFRKGALTPAQKKAVALLDKASQGPANIILHDIDLAVRTDKVFRDLYARTGKKPLPLIAVLFPPRTVKERLFWSVPLSVENVRRILHSPVREKVFNLLNERKVSAVWVFMPGENAGESRRAEKRLRDVLASMEKEGKDLLPDEDMTLHFEILTLSRTAPEEAFFRALLLHTEPDLEQYKGKPMAFPIFGRGRLLFTLVGDGINRDTIGQTCGFLIGACSCEVKAMNPGIDLLLSGVWKGGDMYGETPLVDVAGLRSVSSVLTSVAAETDETEVVAENTAAEPDTQAAAVAETVADADAAPAAPVDNSAGAPLTRAERTGEDPERKRTRTALFAVLTIGIVVALAVLGAGAVLLVRLRR